METKKCSKCLINKLIEEFSWKIKSKNRRASECKTCHKIMRKSYYERNKESELKRTKINKNKIKIWFKELKNNLKCEHCNENHPATLHFHHTDRNKKEINVSEAAHLGWAKERILNEIKKCKVLCANCHAKVHWQENMRA